jgi:uncharacterized repeat protein (TIGR01451 family)
VKTHFSVTYRIIAWVIALAALSFGDCASIAAETVVRPEVELIAELRVPRDAGGSMFVPAVVFGQGQEIDYTVRITNPGMQPIENVTVVQPLPANTRYVAGSATGAGADILFSTDGGQSFARPAALSSTRDPDLPAAPAEYTHIQWQLRYALAPRAVVLARFRAVFQ